ncbi:hypothetical protein Tco_1402510 [Tanacetum coccineum]
MMDDPETKMEVKTPYEFLKDDEKKQLGKNNEANITFYNALPRKEYEESSCVKPPRRFWHTLIITHQDSGVAIDSASGLIDLEESAEIVLGTKEVKAQDKSEVATISEKKVTSLVNVKSQRRTRILLEELGAIVKTTMNRKMMQHVL